VIHLDPTVAAPDASAPGAPPGADVVPATGQGMNAREILAGLWFKYQALRQRGAEQEAATLMNAAIGFMQREGLQAAPEIAAALLVEGRRFLRDGDDSRAITAFGLASRLDPSLASARFALAGTLLRARDLGGGIKAWWDGVRALFGDPEAVFHLFGSALLVLYLGVCWGGALALGLIGLKAGPALAHDLKERIGGPAAPFVAPVLCGAVLLAPLFFPVPLPWLLAFWAAVFFAYARGAERAILLATLGAWFLAGPFGSVLEWQLATASDPVARTLLQSARAGADLRHEPVLRKASGENPDDPVYLFLLASAHRVGGHLDVAMTMYRRVLEIEPSNARAMINLGNLHALRQEYAQAQALYQKAATTDPTNALSHYNSHLAHLEAFNLEAADAELKQAQRVDDALVTGLVTRGGEGAMKRSPQDSPYPRREIWKRALRFRRQRPLRAEAARSLMNPTTLASGAGLLAALLLPGLAMAPRSGGARICERCGRPFCRRCQVITRFPGSCSQCVHLFVLKDGLAPAGRDRKKIEVVRHRRRQFILTRVANLLLPGSGHVLADRPAFGMILLCSWLSAGVGLFLRSRLPAPPGDLHSASLSSGLVLLSGLALLTWLAANLSQGEARPE
jgi:tetratricopeptide (TPR) repeat protein